MATAHESRRDQTVGQTSTWTMVLSDASGPVVLTNAAAIEIKVAAAASGGTAVLDWTAVTPDPDQVANPGVVTYDPVPADVSEADELYVLVRVTWGDGTIDFFPDDGSRGRLYIHPAL